MISLLQLLPDLTRAGVYQLEIDPAEIDAAAKTADLHVFKLDLAKVRGKNNLLDLCAKALKFPRHFGRNWDALNDCLTDLSWLDGPGWVLILMRADVFAESDEEAFHTALDVLDGAAEYWREQGKPFWVFAEGHAGWEPGLPKLTAE